MEEDLATEVDRRKINDKHKLIELANAVIQEKKVDQDKLEVMLDKKFRKRIKETQIPVSTVMYDVTSPIWRNICRSAIDGMARDLSVQQPNAKWVLADAEVGIIERQHRVVTGIDKDTGGDIVEKEDVEYIIFAFEYIDERGESDLMYKNGRPVEQSRVNLDGLAPELAQALSMVVESKASKSNDDVITALLDQNKALMSRLEALESASTPKTRARKSKASTAESAESDS